MLRGICRGRVALTRRRFGPILPQHSHLLCSRKAFSNSTLPVSAVEATITLDHPTGAVHVPLDVTSGAVNLGEASLSAASVAENGQSLGFVPSEIVMQCLNFVHTTGGLPWWATIIVTTLALRTVMLPFAITTMRNGARMAHMKPELDALTAKTKGASFEQQQVYSQQMKDLFAKHQCNPLKSLMGPLVQMGVFMPMFFGLRGMGEFYPSMSEGGLYWFTDLTIADPTYVLPLINAASFLIILEVGADGINKEQMGKMKNVMRGLGIVMVPMTYWLPQGLFMYWISSNSFSLMQSLIFKVPGVKKALDIPEPPPPPPKSANADSETFNPFASAMNAAQKQAGFEEPPPPPPEKIVTYRRKSKQKSMSRKKKFRKNGKNG